MYERFTDRARNVMRLANEEAIRLSYEFVATEHVLLGLMKGGGVAACALENVGLDLEKLHREVARIIPPRTGTVAEGVLACTPHTKRAIDFAREECRKLKHGYVGTEHLLLGLVREEEGVGVQVLLNLGISPKQVRAEVLSILGHDLTE